MMPTPTQPSTPLFQQQIKRALAWIETHREQFWAVVGFFVLAVIFVFFAIRHRNVERDAAWNQLGMVHGQLTIGQIEPAKKGMAEWEQRYGNSSAASYAQFIKADLLTKTSDYVSAAQIYSTLAQSAQPADLRPLALSAQASSEEKAGHLPQALAVAQNFTERYPDHFLSAPMYLAQARLNELTGNPAAASAVYDRFVILFPQSPWAALAKTRVQALSGTKVPSPK